MVVPLPSVIDSIFSAAYDGGASHFSALSLSILFSLLALGLFSSNPNSSSRQEADNWMRNARVLFNTRKPGGPSAIEEVEAILLLARMPSSTISLPEQMYDMVTYGMKLCERVGF